METGTPQRSVTSTIGVGALLLATLIPAPADAITIGCSETALRDAVSAANAGTGDTTIVIPGDCTITLSGAPGDDANASGDLDIRASMTVQGAGPDETVIDGGGLDRVVDVNPAGLAGVVVTMSGITVRNGASTSCGGGLRNDGALTSLIDVIIEDNIAPCAAGVLSDGLGTMAIHKAIIRENHAVGNGGGGIFVIGGASLSLTEAVVEGNTATDDGGGISSSGILTLTDVTVAGNQAGGSGGGVSSEGTTTMTNVTLTGNTATDEGGGLLTFDSATLVNVTISGNAAGREGGGLHHLNGTASLTNITVAGNRADADSAGGENGGGIHVAAGSFTITNTIVAGNSIGAAGNHPDCSGAVTSGGHNLIQATTGCALGGDATGNLLGADPLFGPLARNAGRTRTHALLAGSPAIDAGDDSACGTTDQRGVKRPLDGDNDGTIVCDIGAYERIFVDDGLAFGVTLNQPSYGLGDTLTLDITAANPTGPETPVDAYLGFVLPASAGPALGCPGGDAIAFLTAGLGGFEIHCVSDSVSAFPRLVEQTIVPAALPPVFVDDFLVTGMAGAPPGVYTVFLLLTVPNAFVDSEIGPDDIIRVAIVSFSIP